jgi:hypothetical protein
VLDREDENQYLPADLIEWLRFHEKSKYQAMLLGSNDRLVRSVFCQAARWLLTGHDSDIRRLQRRGGESSAVENLVNGIAQNNADDRKLLWSTIRVELPPLPQQHGDGARFDEEVRKAFHDFVDTHPLLQPPITPLRVTVLVVPPKRRGGGIKDLDNILMRILKIMEDELKPHPAPWLLCPPVSIQGGRHSYRDFADPWVSIDEPGGPRPGHQSARRNENTGSGTWAYQVLELHRRPMDSDEGALVVIPGLGWNRRSVWSEAERYVERRLKKLVDEIR